MPHTDTIESTTAHFILTYAIGKDRHTRKCSLDKINYYTGEYKDQEAVMSILITHVLAKRRDKRKTLHAELHDGDFSIVRDARRLSLARAYLEGQGWIVLPVS